MKSNNLAMPAEIAKPESDVKGKDKEKEKAAGAGKRS